ncbi:MAG: PaaI family thioesterase [Clostridiales bacterium]|nr:PaaI family thioesterase [Clostridiales bacterium]
MDFEEFFQHWKRPRGFYDTMNFQDARINEDGTIALSVRVTEDLTNYYGNAQGGVIFALADTAAGMMLVAQGRAGMTLNGSISYFKPSSLGAVMTATVFPRKVGKGTGTFLVEIRDDLGIHVADCTFTMYYLGDLKF